MRNLNQHNITEAAIARMDKMPDGRSKEVLTSLIKHLHAFARDVKLTEEEWMTGIEFLTATGQKCTDVRQEFILLSDVLGLSMLTVAMNNDKPEGCTEATVFGPFFVPGAPEYKLGDDVSNGASGVPCKVRGTIVGDDGKPVAHAKIDVWQADDQGNYDVQYADRGIAHGKPEGRGMLYSGDKGEYYFKTVVAEPYPIPTDGPVGKLLELTHRHPWRPAHLHFKIEAPGYETLITHVFRDGDDWLDSDAVFGVRQSLVADWNKLPDGTFELVYDFVLARSNK